MKAFFISLACLILGPILVWVSIKSIFVESASRTWPTVEGEVVSAEWTDRNVRHGKYSRRREYTPQVEYDFEVDGEKYRNSEIANGSLETPKMTEVLVVLARYPKGKIVTVHYDPDNPDDSLLEVGVDGGNWWLALVGFGFAIGGAWGVRAGWNELFHGDYDHS